MAVVCCTIKMIQIFLMRLMKRILKESELSILIYLSLSDFSDFDLWIINLLWYQIRLSIRKTRKIIMGDHNCLNCSYLLLIPKYRDSKNQIFIHFYAQMIKFQTHILHHKDICHWKYRHLIALIDRYRLAFHFRIAHLC